jgi:hypothetical protein
MDGAELIAAERRRHVEQEGWTPAHDDEHDCGEMIDAAVCYAERAGEGMGGQPWEDWMDSVPNGWPWSPDWWNPEPRKGKPNLDQQIRNLVKAGALIAAEIDRVKRMKETAE